MADSRFWIMTAETGATVPEFPDNAYEFAIVDEEASGIIAYANSFESANLLVTAAEERFGNTTDEAIDLKMAAYIVLADGNDAAEAEMAAYDLILDLARKYGVTVPTSAEARETLDNLAGDGN